MSPQGRAVSPPIRLALGPDGLQFTRADIEIHGVDQSGPSFEVRVFLNNPGAAIGTPPAPEHGYAGSFHVYGYGVWPADAGVPHGERADHGAVIRAPIKKTVIATEALRVAARQSTTVTVTLVPVYRGEVAEDVGEAFKFERVAIVIS